MTCHFPMVGRLGNLLFIYCYARAYCEANGYDLCLHPWVGEQIFDIPHAVRSSKPDISMPEDTHQNQSSLIYTRKEVKKWLQIKPFIVEQLQEAKAEKPVVLNQRCASDYLGAGLVMINEQSYIYAAFKHGYAPHDCEWEIDILPTRLDAFQGDPWASGYCTTWVSLPSFYKLMTAEVIFRANSTFSWWAATLGNGRVFSPIIKGMKGGVRDQYCNRFVEGNWPVMADNAPNTDLHLAEGIVTA